MQTHVNTAAGLSESEAQIRLRQHGYNEIREESPSLFRGILKRLWGPIPWMLEIALILEILLGKVTEPMVITAWLLLSAVLGGVQERRAKKVLDFLRHRLQVSANVCREGTWRMVSARDLVPGDRIRVKPGDLVPADSIIEEGTVEIDQSALTGESMVVTKSHSETIYSASTIHRGDATATVVATGSNSCFGRTAELVRNVRSVGHLDQLLFAIVRYLVSIDGVLVAMLIAFAVWNGADWLELTQAFLLLIIATVPITMPTTFTVANAIEARALAKEGILVTGLSAVQEAATMDVLCVDKTGTLTHNCPAVVAVVSLSKDTENDILALAAAACDTSTQDPLDFAIIHALEQRGVQPLERQKFVAYDPTIKVSEAYVRREEENIRVILGPSAAVQSLVQSFPELIHRVDQLAASGSRVLAVASGSEGNMTIRGLIALVDTLREDAPLLVKTLQNLGIKVLMVSGDTQATAKTVGRQVGIGDHFGEAIERSTHPFQYDGFAHCYPQDKHHLIKKLQQAGKITGMIGDGVNDAPALKQAEVGIAMNTASDVAKASAQVVLSQSGLQDIVAVIYSGRRVYRRMLTWTLTKIVRTVELATLFTIGYMMTGFFVVSLSLIAMWVILNDIVTITLATDRAWISPTPERWDMKEVGKIAGIFTGVWLLLGLAILWMALNVLHLSIPSIQTWIFIYLTYSAQATLYLTRVRDRFWSFAPSRYVAIATLGNIVLSSLLAFYGKGMAAIPAIVLTSTLIIVIVITFMLDAIKLRIFKKTKVFG